MSPAVTAAAYGLLAVIAIVVVLILWASWAMRDVVYDEEKRL